MIEDFFEYKDTQLRKAHTSDIPFLVEFLNEAYSYQDHAKGEPRTNSEHLAKRMDEVTLYVAQKNGDIIGCFYIEPRSENMRFGLLTVIDDFRGKGLAPAMLDAIEKYAKHERLQSLQLDYMSVAPWLESYYQAHGFDATGETVQWGNIVLVRMKKEISNAKE